jgi:hypothetical protein
MRTTLLAAPVMAMLEFLPHPSVAAVYYPWCAASEHTIEGGRSCAFLTRDQCRASLGGIGGYCYQNPNPPSVYQGSAAPPVTAEQQRGPVRNGPRGKSTVNVHRKTTQDARDAIH